uniref:RRM domain-containing protein n=1 Tax=Panagrellus redivivus TaxID=6233 RepID=A0A7E4VXB2_PANRE
MVGIFRTMKRGYDSWNRGAGHHHHGPPPPGFKKYRRDDVDPVNPTPSKVLHVRNLTTDTTEADLLSALSHFGNVAYTTLMSNGHMALAEFCTMDQARACIAYSKSHQILVRNHPVLVNYSTSEKIQRGGLESEDPSRVIVLTITHVTYPITVDTLKEICSEHGKVNRVALIKRSGMLQALVEFEDPEQASKAKYGLNGADIYDNACTLKVEFGRMDVVKVTVNNADQWDYTCDPALNPQNQIPEELDTAQVGSVETEDASWRRGNSDFGAPNSYTGGSGNGYMPPQDNPPAIGGSYRGARDGGPPVRGAGTGYRGFFNGTDRYETHAYGPPRGERGAYRGSRGSGPPPRGGSRDSWTDRGSYDDRSSGGYHTDRGYESRSSSYSSAPPRGGPHSSSSGWRDRNDRDRYADGSSGSVERYDPGEYDRPSHPHSSGPRTNPAVDPAAYGTTWNGAVMMVYGVNEEFTCDRLFNLLCCYGNCLKIKYMHSKPDTCMVQMGSSDEAANAIQHLQDIEVVGTKLTLRPSKQNIVHDVREPHLLPDGSPAFRDYTGSTVHRFPTPADFAAAKFVWPGAELFFHNAPPILSEDTLQRLFTQKGAPIPIEFYVLKVTNTSTGILRFNNVRDANDAIFRCNNMVVADKTDGTPYVFKMHYALPEDKM